MLGHASLETTQIYTQVSIRQLMAIHAATHPGAKLERPLDRGDQAEPEGKPARSEPQPVREPTADDVHRALDAEAEDDPEDE